MYVPSFVIIGGPQHLADLRDGFRGHADVIVLSDAEAWGALEEILARPPKILAFDAKFAKTGPAAALVARLKAGSPLPPIDLRVLVDAEAHYPLVLAQEISSLEQTLLHTSQPLDYCGTRRSVRFPMNQRLVVVNGDKSELVDLSVNGAQVLVPTRVRPTQPLRMTLGEASTETRCQGHVAWAIVVPTGGKMHYRAGVEFLNPDSRVLEVFCAQHGGHPDKTI